MSSKHYQQQAIRINEVYFPNNSHFLTGDKHFYQASLVAQLVKNPPATRET